MKTIYKKKVLCILLALALVFTLTPHLPGVEGEALAASASTLYITDSEDGESQTVTESSNGKGWNWDAGTATLTLSSFDGSYIEANGDVKIILDGTNRITPANDAQYVIKADGVITIEKTSNDETDKLIIENNAMTSSSFRAIYGRSSGGYKDTIVNGGTVEIKIKNENSSTIYGGYYIYLYGSSNLKIDIDGYNVIGATGIYVNDSADVNVSVNAKTYATGTDHFSALGSGNVTMTATINGDYAHANAKAFDLDAGFSGKGMKLKPGGKVTAKGRISQWRDYNVQAIDDTVKTTPEARILKKESSTSNYLIYHDASGNPITDMTFEGTDTLQPMSFNNPGGLFNIPESTEGTRISTIYLMNGLSSRDATLSLKEGSSLPDGIELSSGDISGTPTAPAAAGTVTIVATRTDTVPIEFNISYGEVKVKQPVTGVTLNHTELILNRNDSKTLAAAVLPEEASIRTVSWNSSHSDIASVNSTYSGSETATVKGLSEGKATITVTTTQGNKQATCTVYVKEPKPNAGIDYINKKLTGLVNGATYKVTGEGITETTFAASETSHEIDSSWLGKTISLVRTNTEAKCNSDAQIIDIAAKPTAIKANCKATSDAVTVENVITGQEYAITAKGTAVTDSDWKSISTSEYTFNGLAPNKEFTVHTRVKATAENVASDVVTTEVKTDKLTQTITGSDTQKVAVNTPSFELSYSTNAAGNTLSYARKEDSSYPTGTTMTSKGVITAGATAGTFTITITAPEHGNYKAAYKDVVITVTAKKLQYFNSGFAGTGTKTYGDEPFNHGASLSQGNGKITYTSSDESVATVDATGVVTILKAGTTTITATAAATEEYEIETAEYTLTVNKANPVVPTNLKGTKGKALSTVTLPSGWAWADSSITMNTTGNQTFKANYTPADAVNYNAAINVDITVNVTESGGSGGSGGGGGGGGGGAAPTTPAQKPEIKPVTGGKVSLSADGTTATITPDAGKVVDKVLVNGKDMGAVTGLKGLKTGDKIEVLFKDEVKEPSKAETDKQVKAHMQKLAPKARSLKTKAGNVKVSFEGQFKDIEALGYTVKYKFYRSTKKASGYKHMLTTSKSSYINSSGKKGTLYYYKAIALAYDKDGKLIAKTELKQCKYASRRWTK